MLSEKIRKLIYILLLSIILYLFFLIFPKIKIIINFIISILAPFLIAFIISFILQPFVSLIQRYCKKRFIAVIIVLIIFLLILFLFIRYIYSTLIYELDILIDKLPDILNELEVLINNFLSKVPLLNNNQLSLKDLLDNNYNNIQSNIFSNKTIDKILSIGKYLIVTPVVLVYLLLDYEKILNKIREYLIKNNKIHFKNYLGEINKTMSSYFRGILFVMFILFMIFTIVFMILDVENGMVFALIIAITNIIPYIGSWIGTSLPVLYVLLSSYKKAIIVLVVCILIQMIEANILTPLVQGKKTKLHPLIIVFSVLLFGSLFGFIGMLIAVPISAFLNITFKYYPLKLWFYKKE